MSILLVVDFADISRVLNHSLENIVFDGRRFQLIETPPVFEAEEVCAENPPQLLTPHLVVIFQQRYQMQVTQ